MTNSRGRFENCKSIPYFHDDDDDTWNLWNTHSIVDDNLSSIFINVDDNLSSLYINVDDCPLSLYIYVDTNVDNLSFLYVYMC